MKIARQELPGNAREIDPSRRVRYDWLVRMAYRVNVHQNTSSAWQAQSYRSLRDGSSIERVPGNKLPGYDHRVPTGQVNRDDPYQPRSSQEVSQFASAKVHRSEQRFRQPEQKTADIAGTEFYSFLTK